MFGSIWLLATSSNAWPAACSTTHRSLVLWNRFRFEQSRRMDDVRRFRSNEQKHRRRFPQCDHQSPGPTCRSSCTGESNFWWPQWFVIFPDRSDGFQSYFGHDCERSKIEMWDWMMNQTINRDAESVVNDNEVKRKSNDWKNPNKPSCGSCK